MERCWTCGTEVSGHHFTCNSCDKTRKNLFESPRVSKSTTFSKFVEYSISDLLLDKEGAQLYIAADISSTLENIASTIEWGFEELGWRMEQMTTVLQSIDHTLKTPGETQANEQRLMAEELRRRGVLSDSEKLFLKSLELNQLDYRTYIGLAQTYLQMNRFDEAKSLLLKSLPHAPVALSRWPSKSSMANIHKSYVFRLVGRTLFTEGKYEEAVEALRTSVDLSPDYALGHYDYAQYCALLGRKDYCVNSLECAILKEPALFALAEKENNFRAVAEVQTLLDRIRPDLGIILTMQSKAYQRFVRVQKDLDAAEGVLASLTLKFGKEQGLNLQACRKECERARGEIKKIQAAGEHLRSMAERDRQLVSPGLISWIERVANQTDRTVNKILDLDKRVKTP